jgi:hypothetical protein
MFPGGVWKALVEPTATEDTRHETTTHVRKPAKTLTANSPSWSTLPDEVKNAPLLIGQFLGDKAALAWGAVSVKYTCSGPQRGSGF